MISDILLVLKKLNEEFTEIISREDNLCESNHHGVSTDEDEYSLFGAVMCLPPQIHLLIDECLELIRDLDENSAVAVSTLNDLMNYDKIETKSFSIEQKDVNPWSILRKTVGPMTMQAKEKNIELKLITQVSDPLEFPSEDLTINWSNLRVIGDSIKLAQVIRNLVSNALKFTPRNGRVTIAGLPFALSCFIDILSRSPFCTFRRRERSSQSKCFALAILRCSHR